MSASETGCDAGVRNVALRRQLADLACALHRELDGLSGSDERTLWQRARLKRVIVALGRVSEYLERNS